MSALVSRFVLLSTALLVASTHSLPAHAQGIPAVSGVLEVDVTEKVVVGGVPSVSLSTKDRPAAFFATCRFGSPEQLVEAESGTVAAGASFTVALPADADTTRATCAVVARFANGLSERRPVDVSWTWITPEELAAEEEAEGSETPEETDSESGEDEAAKKSD